MVGGWEGGRGEQTWKSGSRKNRTIEAIITEILILSYEEARWY